jgi:hypothetical protein
LLAAPVAAGIGLIVEAIEKSELAGVISPVASKKGMMTPPESRAREGCRRRKNTPLRGENVDGASVKWIWTQGGGEKSCEERRGGEGSMGKRTLEAEPENVYSVTNWVSWIWGTEVRREKKRSFLSPSRSVLFFFPSFFTFSRKRLIEEEDKI